MLPARISTQELTEGCAALLAEGGLFATEPRNIAGVHYERVFRLSNMSLRDLLAIKAHEFGAQELLAYGNERITTGEAWARGMRIAHFLVARAGVKPGDRVGIAMRNYPEWCIAYLGILGAGATVVPLNAWWQGEELRQGIVRAGISVVFVDAKRGAFLAPLKTEQQITLIGAREVVEAAEHRLEDILADETLPRTPPPIVIDPDTDFCLLYTSGSTGQPKGALLTHRSAINAVLSWAFLLNVGKRLRPEYPFVPDDPTVLLSLPLFHVTASHTVFLLSFLTGKRIVFLYRWDAAEALDLIRREGVTNFVGVPTMAHEIVQLAGADGIGRLSDITTGGAKRPESQLADQQSKFPGLGMTSGYGLTETNALGTINTLQDYLDQPSSAGRAVPPVTSIEAFDESGALLPRGTQGELCIRSPATFRAYIGDEAATQQAFHADGWFRTGDLGYVDVEGFAFIVDRSKDLIIRGGENISCLEVENSLLSFPSVDEACVFAVPDALLGEIVGAVVWSRSGAIDLLAMRAHVAAQLAGFKVPERIWLSPQSLPRGTTGKIDKRTIRMIAMTAPAHLSA